MIVCDSSTLILLAKSEILDKFIVYFKTCCITKKVYEESTKNKERFDSQIIRKRIEEGKIIMKSEINEKAVKENMEVFSLERGEAEAVTLAIEMDSPLATDDGKAIRAAKILGIEYITAMSFIIMLLYENIINKDEAKNLIDKLIVYGRYSKEIIQQALKEVESYE